MYYNASEGTISNPYFKYDRKVEMQYSVLSMIVVLLRNEREF